MRKGREINDSKIRIIGNDKQHKIADIGKRKIWFIASGLLLVALMVVGYFCFVFSEEDASPSFFEPEAAAPVRPISATEPPIVIPEE